jgi:CheY-like chemotaxis protein
MKDQLKIMVLDDEPIVCKRLKPALEKLGYKVDTFTRASRPCIRFSRFLTSSSPT